MDNSSIPGNGIQHNTRHHASSDYILPADDDERIRLDTQHEVIKAAFENRIIMAPVALKPGDRVLDSGTGAASWLLDFAKETSNTVSIYGIDISSRLFPPHPPSNVQFLVASVTQLPEDWTSTFALVNQRLLIGALSTEVWKLALSEIFRVLEPGGWVNLFELNCDLGHIDFEYGPSFKRMMTILREILHSAHKLPDIVYHLPGWLEQAGFTNVQTEVRRVAMSGEEGRPMREGNCSVYLAMKAQALKLGGFGLIQSEEEYDGAVQAYGDEVTVTDNAAQLYYHIFAQKPMLEVG